MATIKDVYLYTFIGILLFFLKTNFDPELASVFIIGLVVTWIYYIGDKHHTIVIERQRNLLKSFGYALVGYFSVLALSSIVNGIGMFSVINLISQTQSSLAFAKNTVLTFISFAFIVPMIETPFIGVTIEFLLDMFKVSFERLSISLAALFVVVSIGFMYLHSTAKGVTNSEALVTVLIFGFVTCILIYLEKQTLSAILMHIISNLIALAVTFGYIKTISTVVLVSIGIVGAVYFLFKSNIVRKINFLGG